MSYFVVEPEVAGGFGANAVIDRSSERMIVQKLHYQFDGWLGDELLETSPCFIGTERLARAIEREKLTGISFDDVEVTVSGNFRKLYPHRNLPTFFWFKVNGTAGSDDFGIGPGIR